MTVLILLILHYVIFGPKRLEGNQAETTVLRFNRGERIMHYSALVLFGAEATIGPLTFSALPFASTTIGWLNTAHHWGATCFCSTSG